MWKCHKCGKPVYFAERRQSLGFDWHPYCLKCEECGKVLNPGQHAEHKGGPYCHIPCYAALFGPKLFGHGSTTESHRSFGQRQNSFVREQNEMQNRINDFNRYYQDVPRNQISAREANGKLVLEGVMKIYWGTEGSIRLKEFDDTRLITRQRKAMSVGYQFEDVKIVDIGDNFDIKEIPEQETSLSLPYFNPLTHPLLGKNSEEQDECCRNGGKNPEDADFEEFDDIETESFLSYDPLHKWETLYSLVDFKPDTECLAESVDQENIEIPTNGNPERNRRSLSLKPSDLSTTTLSQPKSVTLPSSLSNIKDDLDDLLCVERDYKEHERVYHTVHGKLPVNQSSINISDMNNGNGCDEIDNYKSREIDIATQVIEEIVNNIPPKPTESQVQESSTGKKFVVKKLSEETNKNTKPLFKLGAYEARSPPKIQLPPESGKREGPVSLPSEKSPKSKTEDVKKSKTPRTLRRRPGRRMDKNKLKRRTSFNGHWYDRDTSVFVPPKHAPMCVYTTSKSSYQEVLAALLEKYKIESESDEYALYVVKETGERRAIRETEFPLLLRVNLGPHEEIAKIYLMDREATEEISHSTAQYIRFSFTELRSFLNMFYEEEEREADRIRTKYLLIRRRLQRCLEKCPESNQGHLHLQVLKG